MTTTIEKPRRRWFRLSLRALMILVLVVGGGIGWKANRARTQRRAVAAIKAAGGAVIYDFQMPSGLPKPGQEPLAPKWLRRMIGDEYFQEVTLVGFQGAVEAESLAPVEDFDHLESFIIDDSSMIGDGLEHLRALGRLKSVILTGPGITDERLASLASVTGLTSVRLVGTAVTDAGLIHLARQSGLEKLGLIDAPGVTDEGLKSIAGLSRLRFLQIEKAVRVTDLTPLRGKLPELESLLLRGMGVADSGVAVLKETPRLKSLSLQETKVTDAAMADIAHLTRLESLSLRGTGLTDSGLASIRGLKKLRTLDLGGTKVTDAGLALLDNMSELTYLGLGPNPSVTDEGMDHLARLPAIERLILIQTGVTDAGLARLAGLKSLKQLAVQDTKVTDEGIAALRSALPSAKIIGGTFAPRRPRSMPK